MDNKKREDHVSMNLNNYPDYPEDSSQLDQEEIGMADKILAEEDEIVIWAEDMSSAGKMIFLSIGNTTINMPESIFYGVTRATQVASKSLLKMD